MKYDITKDFEVAKHDLLTFVLKDGDLAQAIQALEDGEFLMRYFEDEPLLEDEPGAEGDFEARVVEAVYAELEAKVERLSNKMGYQVRGDEIVPCTLAEHAKEIGSDPMLYAQNNFITCEESCGLYWFEKKREAEKMLASLL